MGKRKLVIVGDSAFAEIAFEYFSQDSDYEVVGFSVESSHIKTESLFGRPVVPFEEVQNFYPPESHDIFVAIVYTQLNRLRARLVEAAESKGYLLASYISSKAYVWPNARIGKHCFIFEGNTLQPFVEIGSNVILWSGNHIGHHSFIDDHCFISSQVVISGYCHVGKHSFLGVNSTIANNITLGNDNWVGPSVTIMKDTGNGELFQAEPTSKSKVSTYRFFKIS